MLFHISILPVYSSTYEKGKEPPTNSKLCVVLINARHFLSCLYVTDHVPVHFCEGQGSTLNILPSFLCVSSICICMCWSMCVCMCVHLVTRDQSHASSSVHLQLNFWDRIPDWAKSWPIHWCDRSLEILLYLPLGSQDCRHVPLHPVFLCGCRGQSWVLLLVKHLTDLAAHTRFLKCQLSFFFFSPSVVLGTEPGALNTLGRCSTTELHL